MPKFTQQQYAVSIAENLDVGSSVITMKAQDQDSQVKLLLIYSLNNKYILSSNYTPYVLTSVHLQSPFNEVKYKLEGDDKAPTFFNIKETSGELTLKTSLIPDTEPFYIVSSF
jgi:hypothetical protein